MTGGEADDAITAIDLIEDTDSPIDQLTAEGAYDRRSVYRAVDEAGVGGGEVGDSTQLSSRALRLFRVESADMCAARRGPASDRRDRPARLATRIRVLEQGRVENNFFRFKSILGGKLRSWKMESQQTEALIGCHVLKRVLELGRPASVAITA